MILKFNFEFSVSLEDDSIPDVVSEMAFAEYSSWLKSFRKSAHVKNIISSSFNSSSDEAKPDEDRICGYSPDVWNSFSAEEQESIEYRWEYELLHAGEV